MSVAIYDDRLEISSTGLLHFGLTPQQLLEEHESRPWNPLIAQVLYRRGFIESWGRGTLRMLELNTRASIAPPEFEVRAGQVVVRFRPDRYVAPIQVRHDLSSLQRVLLQMLHDEMSLSLGEIMKKLGESVSERTVQDNLQLLRRLGLVQLQGMRRSARWSQRRDVEGVR